MQKIVMWQKGSRGSHFFTGQLTLVMVFLPRSFSHSFTSRRDIHQIIILIKAKMIKPSNTTPPSIPPATTSGFGGVGHAGG